MVDYDFFKKQAEMLNLNHLPTGDCYYIGRVKAETELMRYSGLNNTVTVWPRLYYSDLMKEIRTEEECVEVNTNEGLEELCTMIQMNLKQIKMKHRLSKIKEDF
jgi:hypothetical protein